MRVLLLQILVVLMVLGTNGQAVAGDPADSTTPNFSGTWVLNKKLSDSLQPARTEGARPGGGRGGMGGGGRGGGGMGGKGGGGRGGRGGGNMKSDEIFAQPSGQKHDRIKRLEEELSRLEIFHDGIELNLTNGLDISRLLFTDGRTTSIWTERGEAQAEARWEASTLVVQWKSGQGDVSRTRRYSLSDSGFQITVTESRRQPQSDKYRDLTLVYDKKP